MAVYSSPVRFVLISHHHLFQRDDNAISFVLHYGYGLPVVRLLQAAERPGQHPAGTVSIVNFMPDNIGKVFFSFNISARLQRQNRRRTR